jgi:tetratricopeptide (TPR) repeat protein
MGSVPVSAEERGVSEPGRPSTKSVALVLAAVATAVYAHSLTGGFLNWDDPDYVVANDELRLPFGSAVSSIFTTFLTANWNPLQRLVYLIEWRAFGEHALPLRLTNLALHVACGTLAFLVLAEWLRDRRAAAFAAVAFVVHPANVENVAWIAELKTLIAAACALGAALLWLRGRRAAALAVFAVGLLGKTSIVVLPALLVLLDLSRRRALAWKWYAAFLVPAFAAAFVQVCAARAQGTIQPLHGGTWWTHAMTVIGVLPGYATTIVAPVSLVPRRPADPVVSPADVRFVVGVLVLAAAAWGVARSWRGERRLLVAVPWLLLTLLPTLVVPIPILEADRYLYLGLPFAIGAAFASAAARREETARTLRWAAVAWTLAFGGVAAWYAEAWRSSSALWTHQLERVPLDSKAWYSLGTAKMEEGNPLACRTCYAKVLDLDPAFHPAAEGIAVIDIASGHSDRAEASMAALVAASPGYAPAWSVLATAREALGRLDDARRTYRDGVAACPRDAQLARNAAAFEQRHPRP